MDMNLSLEEVKILIDVMYETSREYDIFQSSTPAEDEEYWKAFDVIWAKLISWKIQMEDNNVAG